MSAGCQTSRTLSRFKISKLFCLSSQYYGDPKTTKFQQKSICWIPFSFVTQLNSLLSHFVISFAGELYASTSSQLSSLLFFALNKAEQPCPITL